MPDSSYDQLVHMVKSASAALSYPEEHKWDYQPDNDDYEDEFYEFSASDYMDSMVYDMEFAVDAHGEFLGARLMIAGGGPTIWVDTRYRNVEGYWGDSYSWSFTDSLGLHDYCEEYFQMIKASWQ